MPKLSELLVPTLDADPEISGLTADSRAVNPGDLFAALPGTKADGRAFISDAVARGAAAVLAPLGTTLPNDRAVLIADDNPRRRFSLMAARFYPRQPAVMVAVTGTNGKTSVTHFARQIWEQLGLSAASLGTTGLVAPGRVGKGSMTTPDPVSLHRTLDELAADGVTHGAFEASSHGLDQFRLDGVRISASAFTNLTRDHLDYHGSMDAYWRAKSRLFGEVMASHHAAVINADSPQAGLLSSLCLDRRHRILSFGSNGRDIRLANMTPTAEGQDLDLVVFERLYQLHLPLAGSFQASNAACALGLVIATGSPVEAAVAALSHLREVPGRLQKVATTAAGAAVYVDFAHTPDGLETALKALRPHTAGKLVVVFGCGGDRDKGKRPLMGRIATEWADRIYVTDDNPRSEDPASIRRQILMACPDATEVDDRATAIRMAVGGLASGDLLVLAGKGHENGQIVGDKVLPFDDAVQARRAVEELS
ncbi:UDP-N-acetylmuramoyl-L-alanyl-D-glutamate--2,6-diaminopimelate ligase [Telmatospirillum sp.]|uniref:UDP-N-acetylmuramoyl-L-alanyl-D-glutamate--2, 6-diaminopimelate ligase n=1 Tax=Telmatospirillum sp. TaxID=2079197 RepID=UPI00284ED5C5|nr:UDP-N-acetylmuramoyl-L-alanyl-D-glutamate--2,6-diaminopimelate ligase [Telmatospirillum sp.]MDR3435786.1 UDP-N-acetylmuramoyl-L-alanyl-D-glutamate--2,6-diaminopimelate ligase [Telmatospirillum sp.]